MKDAIAVRTVQVTTTKTTKVRLEQEELTKILLAHFDAPMAISNKANVKYDCGYEGYLRGVDIEWEETETK